MIHGLILKVTMENIFNWSDRIFGWKWGTIFCWFHSILHIRSNRHFVELTVCFVESITCSVESTNCTFKSTEYLVARFLLNISVIRATIFFAYQLVMAIWFYFNSFIFKSIWRTILVQFRSKDFWWTSFNLYI